MKKAFTLVEMAVVLIIIGVMVIGGFKAIGALVSAKNNADIESELFSAKRAVADYAMISGRLPNTTEFVSIYPPKSGVSIRYVPFDNLTDRTFFNPKNTICNLSKINSDNAITFIGSKERTGDISKQVTFDELRGLVGCSSSSSDLSISTRSMPIAFANMPYTAYFDGSGGIEPYKWCATIKDNTAVLSIMKAPVKTIFKDKCDSTDLSSWYSVSGSRAIVSARFNDLVSQNAEIIIYLYDNVGSYTQRSIMIQVQNDRR